MSSSSQISQTQSNSHESGSEGFSSVGVVDSSSSPHSPSSDILNTVSLEEVPPETPPETVTESIESPEAPRRRSGTTITTPADEARAEARNALEDRAQATTSRDESATHDQDQDRQQDQQQDQQQSQQQAPPRFHPTPFFRTLALMMFTNSHPRRVFFTDVSPELRFIEAVIVHHCRRPCITLRRFKELLPVPAKDIPKDPCGICYDDFEVEEPEPAPEVGQKRRREPEPENTRRRRNRMGHVFLPEPDLASEQGKQVLGECKHSAVQLPCGHIFGRNCLGEWLQTLDVCPYCRGEVGDPYRECDQVHEETV